MKTHLFKAAVFALSLSMAISSCKKKEDTVVADDTTEQVSTSADESAVSRETDQAISDVNVAVSGSSFAGARVSGYHNLICGATIDASDSANGNYTITYDGTTSCINNSRTRSGSIKFHIPVGTRWTDAGTTITMTFQSYKVTRLADNKSLTFAGTKYFTNVNGGLIKNLTDGGTAVVHKIRGNVNITFDDNSVRTWYISRKRTAQITSGVTTLAIEGDSTVSGVAGTDIVGVNRANNPFTTVIVSPVVFSSACSNNAISGQVTHKGLVREITVTFGVDQLGNAVTGTCPYGFKANWTNLKGDAKQVVENYN